MTEGSFFMPGREGQKMEGNGFGKTIGFFGMGNMAQALAAAFIGRGGVPASSVYAYAPHQDRLRDNAARTGFIPLSSAGEVAERGDVLIMACKPGTVPEVLEEVRGKLKGKALVSVALGWTCKRYCDLLDPSVRVQCVMPNTPAMVGEGVLIFEETSTLGQEERTALMELFRSAGDVLELPTSLMGIGGAVSGCGPAFADLMMEAYADAAVKYGIPRATAYRMVAGTLLGAARLQLETGEHPGVLKDRVCSPGGTTIRGVAALEREGFRHACLASIDEIMR